MSELTAKVFQTGVVLVGLAVASLTSAEDRFFDSNGVRLRYVDQGTGDAVLAILETVAG